VDGTFERLVLARPLADGDADLRRVVVRPVQLRGMRRLQFVHTHATRAVAKNLDVDEAIEAVDALIGAAFAHAHLQTSLEAIELRVSRKGSIGLSRHKVPSAPAIGGLAADSGSGDAAAHDRAKRRFVDINRPWLVDLGVTDAQGRLQEVRGAGVVGEEPVLKPGENFEYTSGVPLPTPSGFMTGTYGMVTAAGEEFDIDIPAFSLDTPQRERTIN